LLGAAHCEGGWRAPLAVRHATPDFLVSGGKALHCPTDPSMMVLSSFVAGLPVQNHLVEEA
jgi:hypothetical protein